MIVIIPLGGEGKRFKDLGYDDPKPLIKVHGKELIYWLLDSLNLKKNYKVNIYIIYNRALGSYEFEQKINFRYFNINLFCLTKETNGPVETICELLKIIKRDNKKEKVLLLDGDTFYKKDIINLSKKFKDNTIFYTKNYDKNARYSYIKINSKKEVYRIKEKIKISNNANTGAYFFSNFEALYTHASKIIRKDKKAYVSDIYKSLIKKKIKCFGYYIKENDVEELGEPSSLKNFATKNLQLKKRFCFDLDNTLVTYPQVKGDYKTVYPIYEKIKFLKYLKSKGHYIIIYTARKMRTFNSNISKVTKNIKSLTIQQLKRFKIPYNELVFGKPYAHYYIDDLATNAYENLQFKLGYYENDDVVRKFNNVTIGEKFTIKKSTNLQKIKNEILYYKKIPLSKKNFFPNFISHGKNWYKINTIHSNNLSYLYLNQLLQIKDFQIILDQVKKFHQYKFKKIYKFNIYKNYAFKLNKRLDFLSTKLKKGNASHIKKVFKRLNKYENNNLGKMSLIHGDLVFTNVFADGANNIKLVDPRGGMHRKFSIFGDLFYDYAKIYQSVSGYEHILKNKIYDQEYFYKVKDFFENYFKINFGVEKLGDLKYLTSSLYLSLIPLHEKRFTQNFIHLSKKILIG